MKRVVIGEVRQLLYRPHVKTRAQYYGLCFLNQLELNRQKDEGVANELIGIYFNFFEVRLVSIGSPT